MIIKIQYIFYKIGTEYSTRYWELRTDFGKTGTGTGTKKNLVPTDLVKMFATFMHDSQEECSLQGEVAFINHYLAGQILDKWECL